MSCMVEQDDSDDAEDDPSTYVNGHSDQFIALSLTFMLGGTGV